jgi:hypothetical protein
VLEPRPSNRYLNLALLGSLTVQVLALVVPGLRSLLGIAPLLKKHFDFRLAGIIRQFNLRHLP